MIDGFKKLVSLRKIFLASLYLKQDEEFKTYVEKNIPTDLATKETGLEDLKEEYKNILDSIDRYKEGKSNDTKRENKELEKFKNILENKIRGQKYVISTYETLLACLRISLTGFYLGKVITSYIKSSEDYQTKNNRFIKLFLISILYLLRVFAIVYISFYRISTDPSIIVGEGAWGGFKNTINSSSSLIFLFFWALIPGLNLFITPLWGTALVVSFFGFFIYIILDRLFNFLISKAEKNIGLLYKQKDELRYIDEITKDIARYKKQLLVALIITDFSHKNANLLEAFMILPEKEKIKRFRRYFYFKVISSVAIVYKYEIFPYKNIANSSLLDSFFNEGDSEYRKNYIKNIVKKNNNISKALFLYDFYEEKNTARLEFIPDIKTDINSISFKNQILNEAKREAGLGLGNQVSINLNYLTNLIELLGNETLLETVIVKYADEINNSVDISNYSDIEVYIHKSQDNSFMLTLNRNLYEIEEKNVSFPQFEVQNIEIFEKNGNIVFSITDNLYGEEVYKEKPLSFEELNA